MNDFLHGNLDGMSSDDRNQFTEIASTYLLPGESILEITKIGIEKVQINVGIVMNRRAGTGRKIVVERVAGDWTVTDVQGWIA